MHFRKSKKINNILLNSKIALKKQVQEPNENSVRTIQGTVHSVMTSAPSQQTADTTAPIQNKPVNNQHLYQVRKDLVHLYQVPRKK